MKKYIATLFCLPHKFYQGRKDNVCSGDLQAGKYHKNATDDFFFPFDLFGNSVEEMMCQCFNCSKSRDPDAVLCVPLFFLSNFPLC